MTDWYPKRRFGDLPGEMALKFPQREALVFEQQRYTFAELDREVDRAAKALMALGVETGDHVSLWLNNRAEWLFLMFGLAKVGAVQVPVNTRFRTKDLKYVVFIEEFPMTASGKIRKVELRAEAKRRLASPDELAAAQ